MSYSLEKLGTVYYKLAVSEGDIRQRLCNVQVELLLVSKTELPKHLQKEWEEIIHDLTKEGTLKDFDGRILVGAIPNTIRKMRKKKASEIAKRIIKVYYEVDV